MNTRKVCVVTGTRAEYGLLYWVLKGIQTDPHLELQICVTGMHLSPEFGLTYKQIEQDGFIIDKKIETILSSDSTIGISKSMGLGMIGFAEAYAELHSDIVLVLGDRFEIFAAVSAAMIARIPVAHCHGGEATEGAFDESIRHSITKMSHIHFASTEEYKKRIIQLGEKPDSVFNAGALGIENINKLELLAKGELETSLQFKFNRRNLLITFHPVTLENATAGKQFSELLEALDGLEETNLIFTKANADTDGRIINKMIDDYVARNSNKSIAFVSMGQLRYLSALRYVDAMVGNSSSGLLEAPSFKIGTINIGDRQKGRIKAESVIEASPDKNAIADAIAKLYSDEFQTILKNVVNPYGYGNSSDKIIPVLKSFPLENILKKEFYDL